MLYCLSGRELKTMKKQTYGYAAACLILAVAAFFPDPVGAQSLVLGPYLQNVTDRSVVVRFEIDAPAAGEVRYGPTDAYGSSATATAATEFEIMLDGLSAGDTVHYRVYAGGAPMTEDITFRAAPPARAPFRMLVMGDTRSDHETHARVVEEAAKHGPHLWVHTGDMVSSGEITDEWYTFFGIEDDLMKSVPQFGVIGNHDEDSGDATNYLRFYSLPENSYAPEQYYSFTYGNLHGIVLDGHVNVDPAWLCILRIGAWEECFREQQTSWLLADLAAAAANPDIDHIFVFVHMGPYSSKEGRTGFAQMRELLPALREHGVDMILSGHDHYYERGVSGNNVPYIISAGGGAPLYETYVPPVSPPHSVIMNETVYHYTVIDVDWLCVSMTAYRLDGSVLDSFSYCDGPRTCVNPETDCGTLPPACAEGRWVCEAGLCEVTDCEGVEEFPEAAEEPGSEPAADEVPEDAGGPETAEPVDADADVAGDSVPPDGADAGTDGGGEEGQTGCSCNLPGLS
jgi:predicted phosphodiesterase